jgi:hypothetical protein
MLRAQAAGVVQSLPSLRPLRGVRAQDVGREPPLPVLQGRPGRIFEGLSCVGLGRVNDLFDLVL